MKVEVLGAHNTESDRAKLPCLLVDDVIALDAGGLTSSLPLDRQQAVKSVLLTHHHFDHTRDLIMLAANDTTFPSTVDVYGLRDTLEVVYLYLLDGKMYRDYTLWPSRESPRLRLKPVAPAQQITVQGHSVTPVAVSHSIPAVGFSVKDDSNGGIFYTGDTGIGLDECWQQITPEVLFIEVTGINRMREDMIRLRHLTPDLLVQELTQIRKLKGYIPRVIVLHLPLRYEDELRAELSAASKELGMEIEVAYEGLVIEI